MDDRERRQWDKFFIPYILHIRTKIEPPVLAYIAPRAIVHLDQIAKECFFKLIIICDLSSHERFEESLTRWVGDRAMGEIRPIIQLVRQKSNRSIETIANMRKKSIMGASLENSGSICTGTHVFPTTQIWHRLCVLFGMPLDQSACHLVLVVLQYLLSSLISMVSEVSCNKDAITEKDVQMARAGFSLICRMMRGAPDETVEKCNPSEIISYEETAEQFLVSEKKIVKDLDIVIQVFYNKLDPSVAPSSPFLPNEISALFDTIQEVHKTASAFAVLFDLKVEQRSVHLGESFAEFALYREYDVYMVHMHNFKSIAGIIAMLSTRNAHMAYLESIGLSDAFKYILPILMFEPINVILKYIAVIKLLLKAQQRKQERQLSDVKDASNLRTALALLQSQCAQTFETALELRRTYFHPFSMVVPPPGLNVPMKKSLHKSIIRTKLYQLVDMDTCEMVADARYLYWSGTLDVCSVSAGSDGKIKRGKMRTATVYAMDTGVVIVKGTDEFDAQGSVMHVIGIDDVQIYCGKEQYANERFIIYMMQSKHGVALITEHEMDHNTWMSHLIYAQQTPNLFRLLTEDRVARGYGSSALTIPTDLYRFSHPDTHNNMRFESLPTIANASIAVNCTVATSPLPVVKGGTIIKLVERLTYPLYFDIKYLQQFLLTYRSFSTPIQFLSLLQERYDVPDPPYLTPLQNLQFSRTIRNPIQTRVIHVMRIWVDNHFNDLVEYPDTLVSITQFLERVEITDAHVAKVVYGILRVIDQNKAKIGDGISSCTKGGKRSSVGFGIPPPPVDVSAMAPSTLEEYDILNISPIEIARQLTLIDFELFSKIQSHELVGQVWNKRRSKASNVCACIDRFNLVSQWVTTTIINTLNIQERTRVLCVFVEVAHNFLALSNLNGLMQIMSGIQATPVFRLKHTLKAMDKRHQQLLSDCNAVTSTTNNSSNIRGLVQKATASCIPFVGLYLQDLTFIEEGNGIKLHSLDDKEDVINFVRCRRVATVVMELMQYQQSPYNLRVCGEVRDYVLHIHAETPDDLYKKSLLLEPRNSGTVDAEGNMTEIPTNANETRAGQQCRLLYKQRMVDMKCEIQERQKAHRSMSVPCTSDYTNIDNDSPLKAAPPLRLSKTMHLLINKNQIYMKAQPPIQEPPPRPPSRRSSSAPSNHVPSPSLTTRKVRPSSLTVVTSSPLCSDVPTRRVMLPPVASGIQ
eukprot:CFRG3726T1